MANWRCHYFVAGNSERLNIQAPYIIYYDYSWISFDMQSGVDAIISFRNE